MLIKLVFVPLLSELRYVPESCCGDVAVLNIRDLVPFSTSDLPHYANRLLALSGNHFENK